MRFMYIVVAFALFHLSSAHTLLALGAAKGVAAVGVGAAKLATLGALKFPIPLVIGVKGLGLLKLTMLKKKPLLHPIGIGLGKIAAVKAEVDQVKTAFAKAVLVDLPLNVAAVKIGGVAAAVVGGKTALDSLKTLPNQQLAGPIFVSKATNAVEIESEEPRYGRQPTTTQRPVPAYTPAPPAYTPPRSAYAAAK